MEVIKINVLIVELICIKIMIALVFVTLDIIGTHSKNNVFNAMEIVKHVMDHILINVWLVGQIRIM